MRGRRVLRCRVGRLLRVKLGDLGSEEVEIKIRNAMDCNIWER